MNVKLAAQVFSKGVASTIDYLRRSGDKAFKSSKATSNLTLKMNSLFDIFNAKRIKENEPFKSAINENNAQEIFEFFDENIEYLMSLRLEGKLCIYSRRHTGFVGFIINMINAKNIYNDYVLTGHLENLPLFYNSQDLLESFFSRIRALLGANDNPTAQEFKASIRKLLFYNEITSSVFANCEDNLNILTVSSAKTESNTFNTQTIENADFDVNDELETSDHFEDIEQIRAQENRFGAGSEIKDKEDVTIAYIAGIIEKKVLTSKFGCRECLTLCENLFNENDKISGAFIENSKTQKPCQSTYIICKHVHNVFHANLDFATFNFKQIYDLISDRIFSEILFSKSDFSHNVDHKGHLIAYIVDEYIRTCATYAAQCLTLEQQQMLVRNLNRKTTHFRGQ